MRSSESDNCCAWNGARGAVGRTVLFAQIAKQRHAHSLEAALYMCDPGFIRKAVAILAVLLSAMQTNRLCAGDVGDDVLVFTGCCSECIALLKYRAHD